MPTVEDMAEDWLRRCIHLHTVSCWQCDGKGHTEPRNFIGFPDGAPGILRPENTKPEGCDECSGSGELVPAPHSPMVMCNVQTFILGGVYNSREGQNFGRMNALLDWGQRYIARCLEGQVAEMRARGEEIDFDELAEKFRMSDDEVVNPTDAKLTGDGALTDEELASLGLEPS